MSTLIEKLIIENFLSFNSKQEIDFTKNHISCFIGHNGSGKTNLLVAIDKIKELYLNPKAKKRRIGLSFDQSKQPINLEMLFITNGKRYRYNIEALPKEGKIIKEELWNEENKKVFDLELCSDIGKLNDIEKERIETYPIDDIGIFHLLYSEKVKIQNEKIIFGIKEVGDFFSKILFVGNAFDSSYEFDYQKELYENSDTKDMVLSFMNKLDYSIQDIEIQKVTQNLDEIDQNDESLDGEESAMVVALKNLMKCFPEYENKKNEPSYKIKYIKRPFLKHPLSINLESQGVKRLIEVLTWIYANKDRIILIDELERNFHEAVVINLIHEVNNSVNQFIFTSHLLELMTRDCLTKNQLFAVSKEDGQSVIYSVSKMENIRDDRHSLKKLYRAGRIPGYPYVLEE